jgi:hypothetical protein
MESGMSTPTEDTIDISNKAKAELGLVRGKNQSGSRAKKQKFYLITGRSYSTASGWELLNKNDFPGWMPHPPSRFDRGFREYLVRPNFHISARLGRKIHDFELFGEYWMVSDRTRNALLSISDTDFKFLPVDTEVDPGQEPVVLWLCDVIPVLDAVDESCSTVNKIINDMGEPSHQVSAISSLFFDEKTVGFHHAFRLKTAPSKIVCDKVFRLKLQKEKLSGLSLRVAIRK